MKNLKLILTIVLALSLVLCFAACGGETTETTGGAQETTAPVETTEAPTETTAEANPNPVYTVKVVDESGNPVVGAMVQVCSDNCYPGVTNEEGVATFSVLEAEYKVSFINIPAGFELAGEETEFYFESGAKEMTITLKAVA